METLGWLGLVVGFPDCYPIYKLCAGDKLDFSRSQDRKQKEAAHFVGSGLFLWTSLPSLARAPSWPLCFVWLAPQNRVRYPKRAFLRRRTKRSPGQILPELLDVHRKPRIQAVSLCVACAWMRSSEFLDFRKIFRGHHGGKQFRLGRTLSRGTFHVHSFQGSFFSGNHQKSASRFLKRTSVEKNEEGLSPLGRSAKLDGT